MKLLSSVRLKEPDPDVGVDTSQVGVIVDIVADTDVCTVEFFEDEEKLQTNMKAIMKYYRFSELELVRL